MPLNAAIVGVSTAPVVHTIDTRWLMAYAAGLGEILPCYLDTRRLEGIQAHPLCPVCVEWPAVLALRDRAGTFGLTPAEALRAVHATHDLVIHRSIWPGDRLTTRTTVVASRHRTPLLTAWCRATAGRETGGGQRQTAR
jgi:hypothetical protein